MHEEYIYRRIVIYDSFSADRLVIIDLSNHCFMAHPQSGMNASRILLRFDSSDGSSFPSFLIFSKRLVWLALR